jgi:uncharacterized protein YndB with AHSA1/START domain
MFGELDKLLRIRAKNNGEDAMRFQLELEIDAPRERIIELFLDPDNLQQWQPDLVSFEQIGSGAPREVGAMSKQVHRMGKREFEMIETITVHSPPEEFAATYEAEGVWNLISNRLTETTDGTTRWILNSHFKFPSLIMRLIALISPGMFKKQTMTFMLRFKEFAEKSVREGKSTP